MKYLFFILVGATIFFSLSAGSITPAIVVNHDKFFHVIVFFMLSYSMNLSFPTYTINRLIMVMILLAAGIEISQYLFVNRELSTLDFVASISGIMGYLVILKLKDRKCESVTKVLK